MLTDIQIAQSSNMEPIDKIASSIKLNSNDYDTYGKYKAKLSIDNIKQHSKKDQGKLILVTAINPTPAGEGKTTTTVGLGQAFYKLKTNSIIALREPSLGPVMGIKGGAAGGGYSQVLPMEDINLHFTGDLHAITAANNLISAALDNHIYQGNLLNFNPKNIVWKRCIDMNDRALRNIIIGLGKRTDGVMRDDHFTITAASEIMAVLCLASDISDLKKRIGKCILGYNYDKKPVFVKDLGIEGSVSALLKDALKPNLVQTIEHSPALMHGGPFANIAHGCNSLIATKTALNLCDYVITEAGFGADLGAEKFFDIKCRIGDLKPSCVVLVATIRALKYNGGANKDDLKYENIKALKKGLPNLNRHIENLKKYNLPVIVALNRFHTDTEEEIEIISSFCNQLGVDISLSEVFEKGGDGATDLANKIIKLCEEKNNFKFLYDTSASIKSKIETIAKEIYRAKDVSYSKTALKEIKDLELNKLDKLPICIAKTQYSFSDDPSKLGAPENFTLSVENLHLSNGAGFIVVLTGNIMTMPGLPKRPAAELIDIDNNMVIEGLF